MENNYFELIVEIADLKNSGIFPVKYTHRGEEISPEIVIKNLSPDGKTIVIMFDDLDQPMNHWIIWDIPITNIIPENISNTLQNFGNAKQRSKYRGPNPPKGITHIYQFSVYILNCELNRKSFSAKQLQKAMEGHVIQYGCITGYFE